MVDQTYALAKNGVYGQKNGVYADALDELPDSVVDQFEDGDLSEYGGDTSTFSVTSSGPVFDGEYALDSAGSNNSSISSTSGLNDYPERGDVFELRLYIPTSSGDTSNQYLFRFFNTDSGGYFLWFNEGAGDLILGGDSTIASDTSVSYPTGEWVRCEIDTSSGSDIVVTLEDGSGSQLSQVGGTNDNYDSGGIAFGNYDDSGTGARFDGVVIL